MTSRYLIPAAFLFAAGMAFAEPKITMTVQSVQTDDPQGYAQALAKSSELVKARTGIEKLNHVWIGDFAGEASGEVFVVRTFPSAAAMYADMDKMKNYPEMDLLLAHLKGMRHLGSSVLYKAVRFEGAYAGGAVFNTSIVCSDEAAYAKLLDGLKAAIEAGGFKDAKVNLWRVVSGRSQATHLVSIALPSQARVAELLDKLNDENLLADWYVSAAKLRKTVHNGTYHDITQ